MRPKAIAGSAINALSSTPQEKQRGSEGAFQNQVIELARLTGWAVHHDRPGLRRDGQWRTAIVGDTGFPDLLLVHPGRQRAIFAELKSSRQAPVSPAQVGWLGALQLALAGLEERVSVVLWTPDDWRDIKTLLTGAPQP